MAEDTAQIDAVNSVAQGELKEIVERIERLTDEKKTAEEGIAEAYRTAKGRGWDVVVLKELIKERAKDPAYVSEKASVLDLYRHAVRAS